MARSSTRARPPSGGTRSRAGGGVKAVGRKRQGPSQTSLVVAWLTRVETLGLAIVGLMLILAVWLAAGRSAGPVDGIVNAIGLEAFAVLLLVAGIGVLIWRREPAMPLAYPRYVAALVPLFLFADGLMALSKPAWTVGSTVLSDATAGGDAGRFLMGGVFGVFVWLSSGVAFAVMVWPSAARSTLERTPGAMATVWSWHIPHRVFAALAVLVDFAFPTKAPPDETGLTNAPAWLPEDEYEDEDLFEPEPLPVSVLQTEEPEVPDERLKQAELPVNWWAADEPEEADEAPATPRVTTWKLPPMDLLQAAAPVDETVKPDNALRASLIVDTLASFGVDARVSQYHEGPVVTQFDVEPGWEVKYKQIQERDKDGKALIDKDGKTKTRSEEVSRTRVRVNQITSLSNDLALALAAPSLRIEAPVPGRS
ncbi:MAG TPA: DNA translocase FtsK, partial [Dehalococcoidia bacterium]|nr:DNA translocase FtsK [Dehalococcoidia bacterium]